MGSEKHAETKQNKMKKKIREKKKRKTNKQKYTKKRKKKKKEKKKVNATGPQGCKDISSENPRIKATSLEFSIFVI